MGSISPDTAGSAMTATPVEGHYLYGVILGPRGIRVSLARLKAYKRLDGVRGKSKRGGNLCRVGRKRKRHQDTGIGRKTAIL